MKDKKVVCGGYFLFILWIVFCWVWGAYAQEKVIDLTKIALPTREIRFVFVRGGTFEMGDLFDSGFSEDEKPVHSVKVSSFWMSEYEITNTQFCVFLNEKGNPVEGGVPWLDLTDDDCLVEKRGDRFIPKRGFGNHPVVEVSWYGARAFAEWLECRLPTEAEWEYAARGEGRWIKYPNGDDLTYDDANFAGTGGRDRWDQTSPVGNFPPNALGLYDMAGNVWERCWDWYDENYYSNSPPTDPQGPAEGVYRVLRGGAWDYSSWICRTTTRGFYKPDGMTASIGFRVVCNVEGD